MHLISEQRNQLILSSIRGADLLRNQRNHGAYVSKGFESRVVRRLGVIGHPLFCDEVHSVLSNRRDTAWLSVGDRPCHPESPFACSPPSPHRRPAPKATRTPR